MDRLAHRQRVFTALSLLLLLGLSVGLGGWVLFAAVLAAGLVALAEFYHMIWPTSRMGAKILGLVLGALLLWICRVQSLAGLALILVGSFWLLAFLVLYGFNEDQGASWPDLLGLPVGLLYIPLTLQFFFTFSSQETVLVLLAAITSDTAAFYAGSWLGGRKLWPEVSPKKTWAGLSGGLLGTMAVTTAYGLFFGQSGPWALAGLGLVLGLGAVLGDLFESALKRRFASKDSGCLLPGHGGMLDRIDGLLLATALYALIRLFHPFF